MTCRPRAHWLALFVVGLAVAAPLASADTIVRVTVHPGPEVVVSDAPQPPAEGYYASADVHDPEPPGEYNPKRDCSRPADGTERPAELHQWLLQWRAPPPGQFHGLAPECAWASHAVGYCDAATCVGAVGATVVYDTTTGDYAVLVHASAPGTHAASSALVAASGNSGSGTTLDCVGCPTPP